METHYSRIIPFEEILNFRDLGGYAGRGGKNIAWRKLYRSGSLLHMGEADKTRLKNELHIKTVIELASPDDVKKRQEIRLLEEIGAQYYHIAFRPDMPDYYKTEMAMYVNHTTMGDVYLGRLKHKGFERRLMQTLEIIAEERHLPLLFHCAVGKNRSGILAALLLNALGVSDEDIIADYALSDSSMEAIKKSIVNDPATTEEVRNLPDFTWRAVPESMEAFLAGLKTEYGGAAGYLKQHGADKTLVKRLEKALLV